MTESSSSPRRTPARPNSQRPRGPKGPSQAPVVELATITTPPELILFNAYLTAEKEVERERQRVRQAEITKDKAAVRLKELSSGGGSREDIAAAEQEYRDTVEELRRVKAGEPAAGSGDESTSDGGDAEVAGTDTDTDTEAVADAEATDESTPEVADEVVAEADASEESTSEVADEAVVEVVADATEEPTSEVADEAVVEVVAEATEESTSEVTDEAVAEAVAEAADEGSGAEG